MSTYQKLSDYLDEQAALSESFRRTVLAYTAKIAEEARQIGRDEALASVSVPVAREP